MTAAAMRWASALSTAPALPEAIAEASGRIARSLGDRAPGLAIVFVSSHHAADYGAVPRLVAEHLAPGALVGCSAGGVIGAGREIENAPAVSLSAALLPAVGVREFHVPAEPPAGTGAPECRQVVGVTADAEPQFLIVADPFSADAERFVGALDGAFPASTTIGGLASGGTAPETNALFTGAEMHRGGIAGVALSGDVVLETIVAQGCRPIGDPMFVTACQQNVLYGLDGRPAVTAIQELYARLPPHDQALCRRSLFLGIVMNDAREEYRHGDFLIRNIVALDAAAGAVGVAAELRPGMVVQFHLRDARTSAQDLESHLAARARRAVPPVAGSVLFSCLGRGAGLYGHANHDSDAFRRHLGDVPLGGFFCNGEIGPVQGRTFVHGYTSAFGLFRPRA